MSVLVEGMEMPKGCYYDEPPYYCPFYDCLKCTRLNTYTPARPYKYLPNCPLKEVPTPHGKLVDIGEVADEVEKIWDGHKDMREFLLEYIGPALGRVKTVIEAEE